MLNKRISYAGIIGKEVVLTGGEDELFVDPYYLPLLESNTEKGRLKIVLLIPG